MEGETGTHLEVFYMREWFIEKNMSSLGLSFKAMCRRFELYSESSFYACGQVTYRIKSRFAYPLSTGYNVF